jgi:hypothetical protein
MTWDGTVKDIGGTVRNLATQITDTTTGPTFASGVEFNGGQVTVTLRSNRRYRATFKCALLPGTSGQYFRSSLRYDPSSSVTGTQFGVDYTDCRLSGRIVSINIVGEFTWTGADYTSMKINAVVSGQGGTCAIYGGNPTTVLMVDEL